MKRRVPQGCYSHGSITVKATKFRNFECSRVRAFTQYIVGYVFGGIAESIGWRACFFIEAAAGVPIVLIAAFVPNVRLNRGSGGPQEGARAFTQIK